MQRASEPAGSADRRRPTRVVCRELMRIVGWLCLIAVVLGPIVWVADMAGLRLTWFSVRSAFVAMLLAFVVADTTALLHIVFFSRLPKSTRRRWTHILLLPFHMFAAF